MSREKIQQILASIGSQKVDQSDKIEAAEYNWHQPHCFSSKQLQRLDNFTEKVAQNCTKEFARLYNSDFNVAITLTTQHFADELIASNSNQGDYYLAFSSDPDHSFGLVGVPGKTAIAWATQLLGETYSEEDSDRDLSQLEESLLFDIACGIVKAFSDSCENYDLQPGSEIVRGQIPIKLDGTEEFCKITFNVEGTGSESSFEAYFLILCNKLKPIVGRNVQANEDLSSKIIAKAMLDHVHKLPVSITARLASVVLTFEEIMSLQADDILLLDKSVKEPAELTIERQTIFRGQLVKSDDHYAMLITELCGKE
ncbi:MAG: FliM/FliN family flagellar motor switch protein [Phycisphaerae bacterium]